MRSLIEHGLVLVLSADGLTTRLHGILWSLPVLLSRVAHSVRVYVRDGEISIVAKVNKHGTLHSTSSLHVLYYR